MSQLQDPFAPFAVADDEFKSVRFGAFTLADYRPAMEEGMARARARVEAICATTEAPDFANTILALERSSEDLEHVSSIFQVLLGADGTPEHHQLAQDLAPLLAELDSDISLNPRLFARIDAVYGSRDTLALDPESQRLLESTWRSFTRNGARLDEVRKEELRAIDQQLSALSPRFSNNLLQATNNWDLHLEREEDLAGLPDTVRAGMAQTAAQRGKDGWMVTLHAPSFVPFLTYSERRDLREQVWRANSSRAYGGELDNQQGLKEIVSLRHQRARLLGFPTHADFVLAERMAGDRPTVMAFLDRLLAVSHPAAQDDLRRVGALASELDGLETLMPWDFAFYAEKLKKRELDFDEEELRAFFPLEKVLEGMFQVADRLYDLKVEERTDISRWQPDVRVFRLSRHGELVGLFYVDLFPRATKQGGAWQTTLRSQGLWRGQSTRPHVAIVCNFTPPAGEQPALLRLDEVRTLFHEFGHALHSLLSQCRYQSTGGTSVFWDFVELPSQIMENWIEQEEALALFAGHWQSGAPVPAELIAKVRKVRRFLAGWGSVRQLSFGYLDMAWHGQDPGQVADVADFERVQLEKTRLLPLVTGTATSPAFGHIFAGGYSAGYYSYKWAEVLEADAFERFEEEGIFNKTTAESFRASVLSRGNSAHPMDLFVAFRGRQPDPDALLRKEGLLN